LAFLKRGSPEDATTTGPVKKARGPPSSEGMNSLMIAAQAMTEFGQGSSPSKARLSVKEAQELAKRAVETPTPRKHSVYKQETDTV
jgi:hypothetical protein